MSMNARLKVHFARDINNYCRPTIGPGDTVSMMIETLEMTDGRPAAVTMLSCIEGVLFRPLSENRRSYTFQQALALLKTGHRMTRVGWERGWICMADGFEDLSADKFWNRHTGAMAVANGGSATVLKYFLYIGKQNKVQMGWTPCQEDMTCDDWQMLDPLCEDVLPSGTDSSKIK